MVTPTYLTPIIRGPLARIVTVATRGVIDGPMDLTTNVLLPLLLAAIVANTAIIVIIFFTGRLRHDPPVAATSVRGATMDHGILSAYVDGTAADDDWPPVTSEPTADEPSATQEPEPMPEETPDLTVVPIVTALGGDELGASVPQGTDALTGLPDASAFARFVADEDARVQRYGRSATVVIFELDGLERLTARLGAEAGERIVPALADTIRRLARSADHVARLGPGRFAVLLPETDEVAAINYVERVRRACELWLEAGAIAMRLAIGWAGTSGGELALADAQRIATDRMYTELRRLARHDAASPGVAIPITPGGASVAQNVPSPTPTPLRTETEDDIPS